MNPGRLWRLFVVVTALVETTMAAIMVYYASQPLIVLHGSVEGWVSLVGYSLRVLGEPVDSHIYDYVAFMSVLVFLAAGLTAVFSAAAIASLNKPRWQRVTIPGLFASSLILLVAFSITRALIGLVMLETSHIRISSIRTSAGLIEFPRERIILTQAYYILTGKPLLLLTVLSVTLSAYTLYSLPWEASTKQYSGK